MTRSLIFVASLLLFAQLSHLRGDTPTDAGAAIVPQPTVTVEMGDPGGKFFGKIPDPAKTRHYYIAAEPELWNFAPQGADPICGKTFPASLLLNRVSWKIRYVQYADANFTARVLPAERLGILGPVLRGTTGEYLAITLLNRSWRPISMHPHGLRYDKDSEGSYYKPNPGLGAAIAPGAKFTYVWHLDEASSPLPSEPSSKAWLYHSHVEGDQDMNLGLFGFVVVTDRARARPDGTPRDVDREMAAVFNIFDESAAPSEDNEEPDERPVNAPTGPVTFTWAEAQQFAEEGERHTINGRTFGNLPGLEMNEGEHVRWYLFGIGSEKDFHTAHWHGQRVIEDGRRRTDVVELLPASMKVADMLADDPGDWLLHCHVAEHMESGMFARFSVYPSDHPSASREATAAFFGMPQSLQTLQFQSADYALNAEKPESSELNFSGQVSVVDPLPITRNQVVVQIGTKSLSFSLDASGVSAGPEGLLLVKNASQYGNGTVTGGILRFDLMLKGKEWVDQLDQLHLLQNGSLAPHTSLPITMLVGDAHHNGTAVLEPAAQ